jgi:hypothetical protein
MTDISRYADIALLFGAASVPFEPGSLEVFNDPRTEDIQSGNSLNISLRQVLGKRPGIKATLLDPSLVTAWAKFGAGAAITSITGVFQAYAKDGGLGTGHISYLMASGVIMPSALRASTANKATLEVIAHAHFSTGTAMTVGTSSGAAAAVTKAFYPTSITLGAGAAITQLKGVQANWKYQLQDDDALEPEYYYYDRYTMQGSATVKALAAATAARLEDGTTETVSILLTDANNASNTITINFGTCKVFATVKGDEATIEFAKLG